MTATITPIETARQRRAQACAPSNVIHIEQIAERINRHRAGMDRLLQEHRLGWQHTCAHIGVTGMIPHGEACIWCGATDPNTPNGAA